MRLLRLVAAVLVAVLVVAGYIAWSGNAAYQDLSTGRDHLVMGQASLTAALKSGDLATLRAAAADFEAAGRGFQNGSERLKTGVAFQLGTRLPGSRDQVTASRHLAAIGSDLANAGASAEQIGEGVARLRQAYAGRPLTPADLAALARDADALAQRYAAAISAIGHDLDAAHQERAQVTTAALLPPLRSAFDQVDVALAEGDAAFLEFQDPKRLLSQFLGVTLPE
jgi:hypothetical protein